MVALDRLTNPLTLKCDITFIHSFVHNNFDGSDTHIVYPCTLSFSCLPPSSSPSLSLPLPLSLSPSLPPSLTPPPPLPPSLAGLWTGGLQPPAPGAEEEEVAEQDRRPEQGRPEGDGSEVSSPLVE